MSYLLWLVLLSAQQSLAANDTNTTNDGLSGGAIAGIVIGSLAGVAAIGAAVWYFFLKEGAMYGMGSAFRPGAPSAMTTSPAATGRKLGENHLPMVALKVSENDDI